MSTANHVQLSTNTTDAFHRDGISTAQLETASKLLQINHDKHHIFTNDQGFHDHIAHHLLTLVSLKASPEQLQVAYDDNTSYQRPRLARPDHTVPDLHDPKLFRARLGQREAYEDYLLFFSSEIDKTSWQEVIKKYIFADDECGYDMMSRLFAGLLHSLIHLGFGVEHGQPAIIAEALAQTAANSSYPSDLLSPASSAAEKHRGKPSKTIVELIDKVENDQTLRLDMSFDDAGRIKDFLSKHGDRLIDITSQYHIDSNDDLKEKTAEMINAICYITAGAQRLGYSPMVDFFLMHSMNCSIFFSVFLKQDWMSNAEKMTLLTHKVRFDMAVYASVGIPQIHWDEVRNYKPKYPEMAWDGIEARACASRDDGHVAKLIRALHHGMEVSRPYEHKEEFRVKHDDWLQVAHLAIDSAEREPSTKDTDTPRFVFGAGFEEAWRGVDLRPKL